MFGGKLLAQSMSLIYVQPLSSGLFGFGNGYITSWVASHDWDLGALIGPLEVVQDVSVGAQGLGILTRYRLPHDMVCSCCRLGTRELFCSCTWVRLTAVVTYTLENSSVFPAFLYFLGGGLEAMSGAWNGMLKRLPR